MKKADWILLVAAVGIAVFFVFWHSFAGQAAWVVISRQGTEEVRYPLYEDGTYLLKGADSHENLLEIKGGQASIISANCPDELCVRQGGIDREGESIICLPHKLVIRLEGRILDSKDESDKRKPQPDAMTN